MAVVVAFVIAAVVIARAAASRDNAHRSGERGERACGVERWDVKTLSDPGRKFVYLRPKVTTVFEINKRPMPLPTPRRRSRGYERRVWQITAQVVEYKLEDDGDIHIVLFDLKDAYMIAEMPSLECLPRTTRDRRAIASVRGTFETRCGAATPSWRSLGAVVRISGVGFWDFPHGQRGHARNYAELHPVTRLKIIAGCA